MTRTDSLQESGRFDTSVPVLALRRSIGPFQHCALGIARSLGRVGVPVHAMSDEGFEAATRSRYLLDDLGLSANGPEPAWVDALVSLGGALGGAILLPIDDLASVAVGDHRRRLEEVYRLPAAPPGIERRLVSKRELWRICLEHDLPMPESSFPLDEADVLAQAKALGYPVVVKRAEPWFPPRDPAAPSVVIAHDARQLLHAHAAMESDVHPQVMLQRYIPGESDTVWMFNGYVGASGECLCAFTGRKLRQAGRQTGPTSLGLCEHNPEVVRLAERLLGHLNYRGIVDMGFRFDAIDRRYKLLDVNPRLGSTFRLFVSDDGVDVVRALHLDLTGRSVPQGRTSNGRKWIDERSDLITSLRMACDGRLGARRWAAPLRGVDETAWWAADDPWPFLTMSLINVPRAVRKLAVHAAARPARLASLGERRD